jgi:hypothetical protein
LLIVLAALATEEFSLPKFQVKEMDNRRMTIVWELC